LSAALLIYMDDVIIGSVDEEQHLQEIEMFLKVMKQAGMKLVEKCHWARKEIRYLGFLLSDLE
jgi:hypothetical protein